MFKENSRRRTGGGRGEVGETEREDEIKKKSKTEERRKKDDQKMCIDKPTSCLNYNVNYYIRLLRKVQNINNAYTHTVTL